MLSRFERLKRGAAELQGNAKSFAENSAKLADSVSGTTTRKEERETRMAELAKKTDDRQAEMDKRSSERAARMAALQRSFLPPPRERQTTHRDTRWTWNSGEAHTVSNNQQKVFFFAALVLLMLPVYLMYIQKNNISGDSLTNKIKPTP